MFVAIDKETNNIIDIFNLTYNKLIKTKKVIYFKCCYCDDENIVSVICKDKENHFRHSKNDNKCDYKVNYKIDKYWVNFLNLNGNKGFLINDYNYNQINLIDNPFLIRYHLQDEQMIKNYENNLKKNSKITWILSNYKRGFNKITYNDCLNSYFISFSNKNDIPNFNYEKSIVYIDNGPNILFKIDLRNYNNDGYAFSFISIKKFYEEYKDILTKCPEREIWKDLDEYLELEDIYLKKIKYLKYLKQKEKINQEKKYISNCIFNNYKNEINLINRLDNLIENEYNNQYIIIKEKIIKIENQKIQNEKTNCLINKDLNSYREKWNLLYKLKNE